MAGLDKILDEIRRNSEESVRAILSEADGQCAAIAAEGERAASAEAARIRRDYENKLQNAKERSEAAVALRKRQGILGEKQQLIAGTLKAAQESVYALPVAEYFDLLASMIAGAAHAGSGELRFAAADLERMPADFMEKLSAKLGDKKLVLVKEAADLAHGAVLSYDGIDENCSPEAVLMARSEEMQDLVRGILFK